MTTVCLSFKMFSKIMLTEQFVIYTADYAIPKNILIPLKYVWKQAYS